MRDNKGITLTILIVYMIVTVLVIGILTKLTIHFRRNLNDLNEQTVQDTEFDKINIQILSEVKDSYSGLIEKELTESKIVFKNGNTYEYVADDKALYLNENIKIASNIDSLSFEFTKLDNTNLEVTKYIDINGDVAVIPACFSVSGLTSEQTVDNGLVIYLNNSYKQQLKITVSINGEERTIDYIVSNNIDWTNNADVEYARTNFDQFVWIPVEVTAEDDETSVAAFARSVWQNNARVENNVQSTESFPYSESSWTRYTEPYSYDATNNYDADNRTGIASQIVELTKSIYKNGGFWIGRYEAGSTVERTSESSQKDIASLVIQQDKYPYNWIKWGTNMGNVSTEGAVYLCNNLYKDSDYGVKSMLCTGAAWDSMLDFIKDSTHSVTDSTNWGNCLDSEFTVKRGSLYSDSSGAWTWQTVDSLGTDVTEDKNIVLTTGATTRNQNKNIYDVAGNCYEWTTESIR